MIAKSSARAGAASLAAHLINEAENERVSVGASRDLVCGEQVAAALAEMEAISKGSRCEKHLYHVMLNPAQPLSAEQWGRAWQAYEQEFGLEDQPFIEVEHHKQGRTHRHRVYDRITDDGRAVDLAFNRIRNEKVARILEHEFGHELTVGKHNRAVMARLQAEGRGEVAEWMEQGHAASLPRPVAERDHQAHQIEKRTGHNLDQVKAELSLAWESSDNGASFQLALEEAGYLLARGDKRDFVVLDPAGAVHSPARRIEGAKAKDIRTKCEDLDPDSLPSVEEARALQEQRELARQEAAKATEAEQAKEEEQEPEPEAHEPEEPGLPPERQPERRRRKRHLKQVQEAEEEKAQERRKSRGPQPRLGKGKSRWEDEENVKDAIHYYSEGRPGLHEHEHDGQPRRDRRALEELDELDEAPAKPGLWDQVKQAAGRAVGWLRDIFNQAAAPERSIEDEREQPEAEAPPLAPAKEPEASKEAVPEQQPEAKRSKYQIIDLDQVKAEPIRRGIRTHRSKDHEQEQGREIERGPANPDDEQQS